MSRSRPCSDSPDYLWWRALKVDFFSLTAWQLGMYGWMALVIFVWFGRIVPSRVEFWFLMQTGYGMRLLHLASHELAANKAGEQDGNVIMKSSHMKEGPMTRRIVHFVVAILWLYPVPNRLYGQISEPIPKLNYQAVSDFFQLPPDEHFVEPAGVAVNSKGHIYVFHRGKHPLMEFDSSGKFLRSIADDLFVTAHMVRVDPEDNIWTTDIGSHVVLKLSPDGKVLLALGRMRIPGDDVLHFNQPTDVAWDREGNIYVADGYGNSRVLKFDKYGNVLLGWGMKGTGPGQFDTPHTIVIDDGRVYVGDRENARIQVFDTSGNYLQQWKLGNPFSLALGPDHLFYMSDAVAGRILKLDAQGKVLGSFSGPQPGQGAHFDPHQIALGPDGSIYAVEVLGWRAEKLQPK